MRLFKLISIHISGFRDILEGMSQKVGVTQVLPDDGAEQDKGRYLEQTDL